jgi:hypothetical protein
MCTEAIGPAFTDLSVLSLEDAPYSGETWSAGDRTRIIAGQTRKCLRIELALITHGAAKARAVICESRRRIQRGMRAQHGVDYSRVHWR